MFGTKPLGNGMVGNLVWKKEGKLRFSLDCAIFGICGQWKTLISISASSKMYMGHGGILRVFPVWPNGEDAEFKQLRAQGAFLVSSEIRNGNINEIEIISEQGKTCKLLNPWLGKKVEVRSNFNQVRIVSGEILMFENQQDEELVLTRVQD